MRKLIFLIFLFVTYINLYSQEKVAPDNPFKFNIGLGTGIGLYGGKSNAQNTTDTNFIDAACLIVRLQADYSFIKRFALGFSIERNGFFTSRDSSEKANSYNFGIKAKYKFICKDFNIMYVEILPAYSVFSYQYGNASYNQFSSVRSKGFNFQTGLGWDHYFNLHLGMNLGAYYTIYRYNKIINIKDGQVVTVNNPPENLTLRFGGLNINLGLLYRF